jgi:sulfate adenylyltransferase
VPDLGLVAGLPVWHPPLDVLEIAELVLAGALPAPPGPLAVPEELRDAAQLVLEDAEGTPVARLERSDGAPPRFTALRPFTHGPGRSLRRTPAQVRAELPARAGSVAVIVDGIPAASFLGSAQARAHDLGTPVLWLGVFGTGRPVALPPNALYRALRAMAEETSATGIDSVAAVVAVPATVPDDQIPAIARAYGATEVITARGITEPAQPPHPIFAAELERAVRPPGSRGVTVFFTGLSGSGKSTVAKGLADAVTDRTRRAVSLLDGDEVRRLLSAGLGFGRADRDLNIRRIGFVATEVTRHGGIAICAPIAPFEQAREQVRAAVEEVGDFVLIHVSTPLAECERRDRKGLYARARQGLIADFTGISSPYEVPVRAELRLDTSRIPVEAAVSAVWDLLAARGYLEASSKV